MQQVKKVKIGASISPNLIREAEEIMEREGIPTLSEFISQSITINIDRYDRKQKEKEMAARTKESLSSNEDPVRIVHELD